MRAGIFQLVQGELIGLEVPLRRVLRKGPLDGLLPFVFAFAELPLVVGRSELKVRVELVVFEIGVLEVVDGLACGLAGRSEVWGARDAAGGGLLCLARGRAGGGHHERDLRAEGGNLLRPCGRELALEGEDEGKLLLALADERWIGAQRTTKLDQAGAEITLRRAKLGRQIFAEASLRVSGRSPLTGRKRIICNLARYRLLPEVLYMQS